MSEHTTPITVLKFGSSVLSGPGALPRVVHEIHRTLRRGERVVAVVSAFGDTTDRLLTFAQSVGGDEPDATLVAQLLSTGEEESAALLSLALLRAGIPADVVTPEAIELVVEGPATDAAPTDVNISALVGVLERGTVAVVPGFFGIDATSARRGLLGRGGSDLTALFLSQRLGAPCRLVKDVDGIYESDPRGETRDVRRYERASYDDARRVGGPVVQSKAVAFAQQRGIAFTVGTTSSPNCTHVSDQPSRLAPQHHVAPRPLRIALAGHGTVGAGVWHHVAAHPEVFEVTRVLVRNINDHADVPRALLTTDANDLLTQDTDVLVEVLGGVDTARDLWRAALTAGTDVVSANKVLAAAHGRDFDCLAQRHGARVLVGAAVGGALPALETIDAWLARHGREQLESFEGVFNGTTSFVLDELAKGVPWDEALDQARQRGYAERDAQSDLSGDDVLAKLTLLIDRAFGTTGVTWWSRNGLVDEHGVPYPELLRRAANGERLRLIAGAERTRRGVHAWMDIGRAGLDTPYADLAGPRNALVLRAKDCSTPAIFCADGAGRWPTAEAVVGDLFSLARARRSHAALIAGGAS